ncbi:hypothetical protein WISP_24362 [Willisornis vidua]|uniref:Uncharacterized protein n=1 Tax=Willisornis vidua TaxID=1566151 RepID=A0ABQ9DSS5_9PASS|nr:hypothetical protein WISP_24362 [Willisornis vidua]
MGIRQRSESRALSPQRIDRGLEWRARLCGSQGGPEHSHLIDLQSIGLRRNTVLKQTGKLVLPSSYSLAVINRPMRNLLVITFCDLECKWESVTSARPDLEIYPFLSKHKNNGCMYSG